MVSLGQQWLQLPRTDSGGVRWVLCAIAMLIHVDVRSYMFLCRVSDGVHMCLYIYIYITNIHIQSHTHTHTHITYSLSLSLDLYLYIR